MTASGGLGYRAAVSDSTDVYPAPTRRPGVISFIGVILYVQAFLAAVATISLLIWRNDIVDFLEQEGAPLNDGVLTGTIVAEALVAVLLFAVAYGLMHGSQSSRLLVALAQSFSMGAALYVLVAHHAGGYLYRAVFSLFVGIFVLWSLYGNDEADRFFATNN